MAITELTFIQNKDYFSLSSTEQARAQWDEQKERLIKMGFHTARGMSEDAYRAIFPEYQPPLIETPMDYPYTLLVDPFDPLTQMHDIYHIEDDMSDRFGKMETLGNAPDVHTSENPYQISLTHGRSHQHKTRAQAAADLKPNERFATFAEGLALLREYPQVWQETRANLSPYGLSCGGTALRLAIGSHFENGKLILSEEDRAATPEISHYYLDVRTMPLPHTEINAFASDTYCNQTGGWPSAHITKSL